MKIIVTEPEVRTAVANWLEQRGLLVKPEDLRPVTSTEGQYEDTVTYQIGYEVTVDKLKQP